MWRRRAALAAAILLVPFALAAGTLRCGLWAGEGLESFANGAAAALFGLMPRCDALDDVNARRELSEAEISADTSRHTALDAGRTPTESAAAEHAPYSSSDPAHELVDLSSTLGEEFVSSRDSSAFRHTAISRKLDLIICFVPSFDAGDLLGLDVFVWMDGAFSEVFSSLYLSGGVDDISHDCLAALLEFFTPGWAVLDTSAFPGATVTDSATGEVLKSSGLFALLPAGTTSVTFTRPGMAPVVREVDARAGSAVTVEGAAFERVDEGLVTITVSPYSAGAEVFGIEVPELPVSMGFRSGAALVSLSADGFAVSNIQLTPLTGSFAQISLKPEWSMAEGAVREAKRETYKSFRNTLISLGLAAAASAVSNIWPDSAAWAAGASALAVGAGVVNALDFISDCFAYYHTAKRVYI